MFGFLGGSDIKSQGKFETFGKLQSKSILLKTLKCLPEKTKIRLIIQIQSFVREEVRVDSYSPRRILVWAAPLNEMI